MSERQLMTPAELGLPTRGRMPKRGDWRIGLIGFGSIARNAHAPAYRRAGWTIAAAADPDPAAQQAAREFGISNVYSDYRELIADERVEVVDLLTHPDLRVEVVQACAEAGKPLITEKPLAGNAQEARQMVEIAERAGLRLAVHQNYRWMSANFLVHHIVRRGFIGAPFFAGIEIIGRQDVELAGHPFYATCGDFLTVQWNTHLVDLLRYWTGRDPVRTLAATARMQGQSFTSDNLLVALCDFGPGLTGHILHHELLRSTLGGVRCRVDGDAGSAAFEFWGPLALESRQLAVPVEVAVPKVEYFESFVGSMGDFLAALEEGTEPTVSGRENLATIGTVLAQQESAEAGGRWVSCG